MASAICFADLKADFVACYKPVNSQELLALEHMALCQHQILRGARLEAGLFTSALDEVLDQAGDPIRPISSISPEMVISKSPVVVNFARPEEVVNRGNTPMEPPLPSATMIRLVRLHHNRISIYCPAERGLLPGIRRIAPDDLRSAPDRQTLDARVIFISDRRLLCFAGHLLPNQVGSLYIVYSSAPENRPSYTPGYAISSRPPLVNPAFVITTRTCLAALLHAS